MEFIDSIQFQFFIVFVLGFQVARFVYSGGHTQKFKNFDTMKGSLKHLPKSVMNEINNALDGNRKILAIKIYRTSTGLELKKSKEAIEYLIYKRKRS